MKKLHVFFVIAAAVILISLLAVMMIGYDIPVLNPQGIIADKERQLIIIASILSLIVVVPVFVMLFVVAWKYRAGNKKSEYRPDWDGSRLLESLWWGIPCAIILVLGVITWNASHDLDPYKPLDSAKKPVNVQVVALQWKWLFIYPDYDIASVNLVQFPAETPINFSITADAPMNSFWIPSLGGQVYAMGGMSTKLHLMADKTGDYNGSSANISGEGFSGMKFTARATSRQDFDTWVATIKKEPRAPLDMAAYEMLAKPTKDDPVRTYSLGKHDLYDAIIMKYMPSEMHEHNTDTEQMHDMQHMEGMAM